MTTLAAQFRNLPSRQPILFLVVAAAVWLGLYQSLTPVSETLVAALPVVRDSRWLLPINVEAFFAGGDIDAAVREAAHQFYGLEGFSYE